MAQVIDESLDIVDIISQVKSSILYEHPVKADIDNSVALLFKYKSPKFDYVGALVDPKVASEIAFLYNVALPALIYIVESQFEVKPEPEPECA